MKGAQVKLLAEFFFRMVAQLIRRPLPTMSDDGNGLYSA